MAVYNLYTKHGFSPKVFNVDKLEKIYDLIEGKWRIETIGISHHYFVYNKNAITDEVKELQKGLAKDFWSYRRYNTNVKKIVEALTEEEWQNKVDKMRKEEEERNAKRVDKNRNRGVYGIYVKDELVYIGKTDVNFETRFRQHNHALDIQDGSQFLYRFLSVCDRDEIIFKPLINVPLMKVEGDISNRDIEAMELGLITLYQPICNIQGRVQDYKFT